MLPAIKSNVMMDKKWTEQTIRQNLIDVAETFGIDRMPSASEMKTLGRGDLCNAICKSGGFREWAKKMGWSLKSSETQFGQAYEDYVGKKLVSLGHTCEMTSTRHPYDIYADECVKIDVKASRITQIKGYDAFSYRLEKPIPTCDIYILIGIKADGSLKEYVVPSHHVKGNVQICISPSNSVYDKYLNKYEYINKYAEALKAV